MHVTAMWIFPKRFMTKFLLAWRGIKGLPAARFESGCRISSVGDHPVSSVEDHLIS